MNFFEDARFPHRQHWSLWRASARDSVGHHPLVEGFSSACNAQDALALGREDFEPPVTPSDDDERVQDS